MCRGVSLSIDSVLSDLAPPAWADQIEQRLADSGYHREVVFFHRMSRTLILTDLIANFEPDKMPWWVQPLLKLGRVSHPDGRVPRDMAASFRKKGSHLKNLVETMMAWAPERIILAHGRWYDRDDSTELRRAFRNLL